MNNIPLACADFSFPLIPHDLALDLIAGLQIGAIDLSLMAGYSHLDIDDCLHRPSATGREVASKLSARNLKIADVNFAPGFDFETLALNHPSATERSSAGDLFRRAVEFAVNAQTNHMTVLPGIHWPEESEEESFKRCVGELEWRLQYAAEMGVVVAIEAHLGSIVPTPAKAEELLGRIPGLTLTLDYTHFVYQGFSQTACDALIRFASHFHARGGAPHRLQTSVKNSTIDYRAVLREMYEKNYSGYFALEYVWLDWEGCNESDNLSETVLLRDLAREELKSLSARG